MCDASAAGIGWSVAEWFCPSWLATPCRFVSRCLRRFTPKLCLQEYIVIYEYIILWLTLEPDKEQRVLWFASDDSYAAFQRQQLLQRGTRRMRRRSSNNKRTVLISDLYCQARNHLKMVSWEFWNEPCPARTYLRSVCAGQGSSQNTIFIFQTHFQLVSKWG